MAKEAHKERLSIYLIKAGTHTRESILKMDMVSDSYAFELTKGTATLFLKRDPPARPPQWTGLFTSHPDAPEVTFGHSKSVGAVLHVVADERDFLLSFGTGFHLVRHDMTERDFGLRVTLNAVEPDKLRSIDKASYDDNPLNFRTQSTLQVDIFDLQVNAESDLVYAVTGACKYKELGTQITGRDALTLMVETDLNGLEAILVKALALFSAQLPAEYRWIDNVAKVKDPETVLVLDLLLDELIADTGSGNLWLGEPEIVEWETNAGYSFDRYSNSPRYQVLNIEELKNHITSKGIAFNLDSLKTVEVHINDSNFISVHSWPAYRCLYAEIANGGDRYVLRNGTWFKIESDFIKQIDAQLANIKVSPCTLPPYSFANEGDYNLHVAKLDSSFHLMDKKTVKTGGPHDKIEFCDLIEGSHNFIHVKYYRSSATLSHLFSQGTVAGETFIRDEDFRKKLNAKLPAHVALADTSKRPDAAKYCISYAIATDKVLPGELPFFSKISLKNAAMQILALGFQLSLIAIPIDPALPKSSKHKPKAAK